MQRSRLREQSDIDPGGALAPIPCLLASARIPQAKEKLL